MSIYLYTGRPVHRPYIYRNPVISQVLALANPLRLFALVGRFSPASSVVERDILSGGNNAIASGPTPPTSRASLPKGEVVNITIIDPDKLETEPSLADKVSLDFIPTSLTVSPSSMLAPIRILGANNSTFHFGGSDDTVTFKIDWYGYIKEPVIKKCRFIESLCKADGWTSGPPEVRIDWGNGRMFEHHNFIVTKAPYTMKTFVPYKSTNRAIELVNNNLWPIHATQTITMKRVSSKQLTHKEIRRY